MSSAAVRSKPFIRALAPSDVYQLALTMRLEDMEEIFHASGRPPLLCLIKSVAASDSVFTIEKDGAVVAIFGVVGVKGQAGSPWMLGTPAITRCWSLLRECRQRLDSYTEEYHHLTNAVWSKNTVHIEWLKWLGFQFEGSSIRNGETFLHFHRSSTHVRADDNHHGHHRGGRPHGAAASRGLTGGLQRGPT